MGNKKGVKPMPANIYSFGMLEGSERPWWVNANTQINTWPKDSLWEKVADQSGLAWNAAFQPLQTINGKTVTSHRAIVREDTGEPISVVKNRYHIVQPKDSFKFFDEVINGIQYYTAGSLGNGSKLWVLAKMPYQSEIVNGDKIDNFVLLSNSFDGATTLKILFTPIRVVCQNTLIQAEITGNYLLNAKHTESVVTKIQSVKGLLSELNEKALKTELDLKKMQSERVTDTQIEEFLKSLLAEGKEETSTRTANVMTAITDLYQNGKGTDIPGVKGTYYGLYNAITEYTDHFKSVRGEKEDVSKRFESINFGTSARLKEDAFTKIMNLVNT